MEGEVRGAGGAGCAGFGYRNKDAPGVIRFVYDGASHVQVTEVASTSHYTASTLHCPSTTTTAMAAHGPRDARVADGRPSPKPTEPAKRSTKARVACTVCHRRKVRCNLGMVGMPCSNCLQDETECLLHVSARGKHKRPRITPPRVAVTPQAAPQQAAPPASAAVQHPGPQTVDFLLTPEATVTSQHDRVAWAEHVARPVRHEAHLEPVFVG